MFQFTTHAVERFIERVRPGVRVLDAIQELHDVAPKATFAGRNERTGDAIWTVAEPPIRFVVKHEGKSLVVVTFVDGLDGGEQEAADDVLAAYERAKLAGLDGPPKLSDPPSKELASGRAYRQWLNVEQSRIGVWREAVKAGKRREELRVHLIKDLRRAVLQEAAGHLRKVDPRGAARLIERIEIAAGEP